MKKSLAILMVMALMLTFTWTVSATGVGTPTATVDGTQVAVSGTITDGANNQQITIMVVKDGVARADATSNDIAYVNQDTCSGSYSFTFEMPSNMQTGTYDVYVGGTGVSTLGETSFTLDSATEAPTEVPTQAPSGATVTGNINIDPNKYHVTATANGEPVDITVAANGDYTITLPAAGNYTIVIDAETMVDYSFPVTEQDGTSIEGPSIIPILGDYNNDGNITSYDVGQVMGKLAASGANFNAFMDFNNDTNITSYDVGQIMGKVGASY